MNNTIEKLVIMAREEEVPGVDVCGSVMDRIHFAIPPKPCSIKSLGIFAGLSTLAASIIIIFSVHTYRDFNNPMNALFAPLNQEPLLAAFYEN